MRVNKSPILSLTLLNTYTQNKGDRILVMYLHVLLEAKPSEGKDHIVCFHKSRAA